VNTEAQTQLGTCTLLAPHWALTAAHVVADMTECSVMTSEGLHRVDRVFVHKDYTGDHGWHDIALVHVVTPFTLAKMAARELQIPMAQVNGTKPAAAKKTAPFNPAPGNRGTSPAVPAARLEQAIDGLETLEDYEKFVGVS
jgi:V8-like Glu-specific endopeptidase